jgi:Ran GTPase-activating protein (RanGAP) involved in mRNA processing and transport
LAKSIAQKTIPALPAASLIKSEGDVESCGEDQLRPTPVEAVEPILRLFEESIASQELSALVSSLVLHSRNITSHNNAVAWLLILRQAESDGHHQRALLQLSQTSKTMRDISNTYIQTLMQHVLYRPEITGRITTLQSWSRVESVRVTSVRDFYSLFRLMQENRLQLPSIRVLDLSDCEITEGASQFFAIGMKYVSTLEQLNLSYNDLGGAAASNISRGLKRLEKLRELDLSYSHLSGDAIQEIASALQHTPQLAALRLDGNNLGDDGAGYIANSFASLPRLEVLSLWDAGIGEMGAHQLTLAFEHIPQLRLLDLWKNRVGEEGAKSIAQGLRHVERLQSLSIRGDYISDAGAQCLCLALTHLKCLRTLSIGSSSLSFETRKMLRELIPNACMVT